MPFDAAQQQAEPDLAKLKRWFEESQTATADARRESEIDRDYHDGKQLSDTELRSLRRRRQPPTIYNKVVIAVNGMVGVVERSKTDPKAWPRNAPDEQGADVVTKTLRFIADQNRLSRLKTRAAKNFFVEGTCAAIVEVEPQKPDYKIVVRRIPWDEYFFDPYAKEEDFSDKRFDGVAKWMDLDALTARYKDKADTLEQSLSQRMGDPGYTDKPEMWRDTKRKRLMVVEMYHMEAEQWMRCVFVAGGWLEYGPSPYHDEDGRPCDPIEAACFARDRENLIRGAVRDMRSPQDNYNKRQSKLTHLLNSRQTFGSKTALGEDANKVKEELAKPDGHIELNHGEWGKDFGIIPIVDQAGGQFNLLQEDKAHMERLLPNPGILGRDVGDKSGKAMLTQQAAGLTELADPFGNLTDWELRLYKQCWWRARQFWTAPRMVRVTDDLGAMQFVQVNEPVLGPDGQPQIDPMTGQPQVKNRPLELDVDVTLDVEPEQATMQQEQFSMLVEMAKNGIPIPPDMIVAASQLKDKGKIIEGMKQAQQAQQQAQMQQAQAAAGKLQSETDKNMASANKTQAEADNIRFDTGHKVGRMEAGEPHPDEIPPPGPQGTGAMGEGATPNALNGPPLQ